MSKQIELFAVIGQNAHHDTAVATGPHTSWNAAIRAAEKLADKGWNTEIVQLSKVSEIPDVEMDENFLDGRFNA